ncbi:MAG: hypothetical protein HYZ42_16950, partial [Bacteroidetes bacterium]|nr:hypothetical protein [Bacteroidota bacterium]
DSSSTVKDGVATFNCSFAANTIETKTGKKAVLYYMFEDYLSVDAAKKEYASIKTANQNHGITLLNDLGDEAYFHTDNDNFYFILARKGTKMFRLKLNKITNKTSLYEFNALAKKITGTM